MTLPIRILVVFAAAAAAACSGTNGAAGANGKDGLAARVAVTAEPPGAHCAAGGVKISAGLDTNANGTLDAAEVTSEQYVCAAAGTAGKGALVALTDEPAGANCAAGGKRVTAGVDANGDGTLQAAEVASTAYVCNGAAGTAGAGGVPTLVAIAPDAVTCTNGGSRVTSGADTNGNGALDPAEVTATAFACNGAPGASLAWQTLAGPGPVQAQPNTGYIAASDAGQVHVALPTNAKAGDIVRVVGAGAGGWVVDQAAGQAVNARGLGVVAGDVWTPRNVLATGDVDRYWWRIGCSADGLRVIAVEQEGIAGVGTVWTSGDGGATFTKSKTIVQNPTTNLPELVDMAGFFQAVAISGDGQRAYLAETAVSRGIYASTDGGATFNVGASSPLSTTWRGLATSFDGATVLASSGTGDLFVSKDAAATWTPAGLGGGWSAVAMSPDGTRMLAGRVNGPLHVWTAASGTWTPSLGASQIGWVGLGAGTGKRVVAVSSSASPVLFSDDDGDSWTPSGPATVWSGLAATADARQVLGVTSIDLVSSYSRYRTVDGGVTYTLATNQRSNSACSSAGGDRLVAGPYPGRLQFSSSWTTEGPGGAISGLAFDAVELQYLGAGRFTVLSHSGSPTIE